MGKNLKRYVYGLYGSGGFSREVMPLVKHLVLKRASMDDCIEINIYYVDMHISGKYFNDVPVISESEFVNLDCDKKYFNVAIASSEIRQKVSLQMLSAGITPYQICAPNVVMYDGNSIGEGAIFCPFSIITSNVKIGRFFHSNLYSYIAHDCLIGDYVTFAPNVHCNGNIIIENNAYIGAGAIIKQGTPDKPLVIGEGAIVGMGAVVTKSVQPHTTVVGNPARLHSNDSK